MGMQVLRDEADKKHAESLADPRRRGHIPPDAKIKDITRVVDNIHGTGKRLETARVFARTLGAERIDTGVRHR